MPPTRLPIIIALAHAFSAIAAQPDPAKPDAPATPAPAPVQPTTPSPAPTPAPTPTAPPTPTDPAKPPAETVKSAENAAIANEITPELDEAIARGIEFLCKEQQPDGSFGSGRYAKNVAVTSLACLALLADGHTPSRGERSKNVLKGLEFILASSTETGLIAADSSNGPMYGHGFATLFLGEVYGMTQGGGETRLAERTHEALVKAIRLIERSQNNEGGWRYNPVPFDADVSVTICQVMALRSARNAGIEVPKETIDKAVEYVKQCQNSDGGFRYQLTSGFSAWPRSAAGVATLFYAGIYKDEAIDKGTKYLVNSAMPGGAGNINTAAHYFYGHYYSVQAMYLAGGDSWAKWWPAVRAELLRNQRRDGAWDDPSVGPSYGTAMALIVLQMPKRFLPIFQK
ncbi:MAG: terpene cyclase/mutase family protein [Phycisphaerales bacterium]|nr:terpene cyclase/mutase family protein [Phycisphaerales bacterium]